MSKPLLRDLEALKQNLLAQSAVVEQMIYRAARILRELETDSLEKLHHDEDSVNRREVAIEEKCLNILALHQPVAVDLRRVATVLKINGELERIADLAVNIGERAQALVMYVNFPAPSLLDEMVEESISMVRSALDAFVRLDAQAARDVCIRDDIVDDLNRTIIRNLNASVQQHLGDFEPAMQYFSASRHIERIADHATNIAEDVIYLVDGAIARHHQDKVAPLTALGEC